MTFYVLCTYLVMSVIAPESNDIHEFHLSKCDIDYNVEANSLQIALSLFIDDLEGTLSSLGHDNLHICSQKEATEAEEIIFNYIQDHLLLRVDHESMKLNWVGKEISEDLAAVWCYLEVTDVLPKEIIHVQNDLLMESFDDQQNVVKLEIDKTRKSFFLFNKQEFSGSLEM